MESRQVVHMACFLMAVASDLRRSTADLIQGKWFRLLLWCRERNMSQCKTTVLQIAEFFLYMLRMLKLSISAGKGYRSAFNHVFSLGGTDLAASWIISRMFSSFEKTCSQEKLTLCVEHVSGSVLGSLTVPPYEPHMLPSDKHLT